jgi:hypothetical protein
LQVIAVGEIVRDLTAAKGGFLGIMLWQVK